MPKQPFLLTSRIARWGYLFIALYILKIGPFAAYDFDKHRIPLMWCIMSSVFILYRNALFAHGLERLLREEGIEVVGSALSSKHALDQIAKFRPDIIITEAEGKRVDGGILLTQLLRTLPRATVVRLSLDDNRAHLYTGRSWTADTGEDLVRGILDSVVSAKSPRRRVSA